MAAEDSRPRVDFLIGERGRPQDAMSRCYTELKQRMTGLIDGREVMYSLPPVLRTMPLTITLTRFPYAVGAWMRRREHSIVHIHNQTLGLILHLNDFSPSVVHCHDIIELVNPEYRATLAHRAFIRLYISGTMKADVIITPSKFTADDIKRRLSPRSTRIEVVQDAVNHEQFHPVDRRIFLRRFGLPEDRRYILYVGSERPAKNVPAVVRAFTMAKKEFPDLAFIKVGAAAEIKDYPVRTQLLRILDDAGLRKDAFFLERIPEELLPAAYCAADVFVFPSLYEGFGLPVLEAMACGTPVVSSNVTSLPEVAGDAALLVPPDNDDAILSAVTSVLRDRRLGQELSARGKKRAAEFNWDKSARVLLNLYNEMSMWA